MGLVSRKLMGKVGEGKISEENQNVFEVPSSGAIPMMEFKLLHLRFMGYSCHLKGGDWKSIQHIITTSCV